MTDSDQQHAGGININVTAASPGPPSPPMSLAPTAMTGATHWTQMPPMPDPNQIKEVLASMQATLESLGANFTSLGQHTNQVSKLQTDLDHTAQIQSLRKHMGMSDAKHEQKMEEIKGLLKDVLKEEVVPYINDIITEDIDVQLDSMLHDLVAEELALQIPQHLQAQIAEHKQQLQEVQISLHNSEARRANALLRSSHLKDPLQPLIGPKGVISSSFPRDLTALFALDAPAAKALNEDYGLPDIGDSRERNLNRFMQHCGVAYQMTPAGHFQRPGSLGKLTGVRNPSLRKVRFLASPISPSFPTTPSEASFTFLPSPPASPAFSMPGAFPDAVAPHVDDGWRDDDDWRDDDSELLEDDETITVNILVPKKRRLRDDNFGVKFLVGLMAATSQLTAIYLATEHFH